MVDEAGDIVAERQTGRIGTVTRVKGNKVRVRFDDTPYPQPPQEMNFKKKQLYSIREKKDMPGHVREAEQR
jgi:hypothetical protein